VISISCCKEKDHACQFGQRFLLKSACFDSGNAFQRPCLQLGMAVERAKHGKVSISLDLGQHPHPDGTISFYGVTPSGFDFEIGAGCKEIEPKGWQPLHTSVTSSWDHKPSLRLQMKMAASTIRGAGRMKS
jgi:hypothetical protein